jgi:hypothetical protein
MRNGLKVVAMSAFLLAALLSTGCGQNALMNPISEQVGGDTAANQAGHNLRPAGHNLRP